FSRLLLSRKANLKTSHLPRFGGVSFLMFCCNCEVNIKPGRIDHASQWVVFNVGYLAGSFENAIAAMCLQASLTLAGLRLVLESYELY
ncbi:MAG: hypothetical protein KKD09_14650, partial [Gammaproteobacteria bacterium]|nr:hypothetical protein [Gammaproteobacteria bacterium]